MTNNQPTYQQQYYQSYQPPTYQQQYYQPTYQPTYQEQQPIYQQQQTIQQTKEDRDRKLGILLALVSVGLGIKRYVLNKSSTEQSYPLAYITLSPTNLTLITGSSRQLVATCKDSNTNTMDCPTLTWSSTTNASITQTGYVTALSPGTATITATDTSTGITSQLSITITQTNLYVSASTGNDSNSGTTRQNPVKTITKAISLANNTNTILALNGTYSEQVRVEKSISIFGEDKNNTIIDGINLNLSTKSWPPALVYLHADNIIFSGFKVQNPTAFCDQPITLPCPPNPNYEKQTSNILAYGKNNIDINNNIVYNAKYGGGIVTGQCNNVKIRYNEISRIHYIGSDGQETISIGGGTENFEVSYNYLHDNGLRYDGTSTGNGGIYVKGVRNGSVHHNFIKNCHHLSIYSDGWDAPTSNPQKNIKIYKNIVTKDNSMIARGITIANEMAGTTEYIDVADNIVFNCNVGFQIWCGGANPNGIVKGACIKNNTLYKNSGNGIFLGSCQTYQSSPLGTCSTTIPVEIIGNTIANNGTNLSTQTGVPTTAYNSDWNTINTFLLTQSDFDTIYNALKNEIKLLNDSIP